MTSYSAPQTANNGPGISEAEAAKLQALPPRLIKGMQADYVRAPWDGENTSGLHPFGPNLLVLMDLCSSATGGGLLLPDEMIERMNEASVSGVIYEIGEGAFLHQRGRPEPGQRVCIEKYAGIKQKGRDGRMYRFLDEKCVAGLVDDDLHGQPEE